MITATGGLAVSAEEDEISLLQASNELLRRTLERTSRLQALVSQLARAHAYFTQKQLREGFFKWRRAIRSKRWHRSHVSCAVLLTRALTAWRELVHQKNQMLLSVLHRHLTSKYCRPLFHHARDRIATERSKALLAQSKRGREQKPVNKTRGNRGQGKRFATPHHRLKTRVSKRG